MQTFARGRLSSCFFGCSAPTVAIRFSATALGTVVPPPTAPVPGSGAQNTPPVANKIRPPKHGIYARFTKYDEIGLPTDSKLKIVRSLPHSGAEHEWVVLEKIHGANFSVFLFDENRVEFGKRSGLLVPNEEFFGYQAIQKDLERSVRSIHKFLKQKYQLPVINKLILHGELFGNKYDHPQVPKCMKYVTLKLPPPDKGDFQRYLYETPIQEEYMPQYSPELHFSAFDIRFSVDGEGGSQSDVVLTQMQQQGGGTSSSSTAHPSITAPETPARKENLITLSFDEFSEVCSKTPGLMYSKPLMRGTFDKCITFDVENFETPLPAVLGLGDYPLKGNLAEGAIVRHVMHGTQWMKQNLPSCRDHSILKLRGANFMESKHRGEAEKVYQQDIFKNAKAAALASGGKPDVEWIIPEAMMTDTLRACTALIDNLIAMSRCRSMLSKLGGSAKLRSGEVSQHEFTVALSKDVFKDFLKTSVEEVITLELTFRKKLATFCWFKTKEFVEGNWAEISNPSKQQ